MRSFALNIGIALCLCIHSPALGFLPTSQALNRALLTPKSALHFDKSTAALGQFHTGSSLSAFPRPPPTALAIPPSLVSLLPPPALVPSLINAALFYALQPKLSSSLTPSGLVHAFLLSALLSSFGGWTHWAVGVAYFAGGVGVTRFRMEEKEKKGIAEGRGGRRGPENVWGSAAVALVCSMLSAAPSGLLPLSPAVLRLAFVSAFATKLADTFASEIGKGYGRTTFLITSFKRVPPGTEGAVSAEGTAAAAVGGGLLAGAAVALGVIAGWRSWLIATGAAFFATNVESVIGATIQKGWMTNEVVNFVNTLVGAVTAAVLAGRWGL